MINSSCHVELLITLTSAGFNVETVVWDVCNQNLLRGLWRHYYQNTKVTELNVCLSVVLFAMLVLKRHFV